MTVRICLREVTIELESVFLIHMLAMHTVSLPLHMSVNRAKQKSSLMKHYGRQSKENGLDSCPLVVLSFFFFLCYNIIKLWILLKIFKKTNSGP